MNYKRMLVLAPHTDDAELGCGGTIAKMLENGVEVYVVAFSTAEDSVPKGAPRDTIEKEFYASMKIFGLPEEHIFVYHYPVRKFPSQRQEILEDLIKLRREINPDLVLIPSSQDVHQDHHVIHEEGVRAFKERTLLGYELPWNQIVTTTQGFVELSSSHIERKWEAMQAYKSQVELRRSYFTDDFVKGLAKLRGLQLKVEWAEAFEVIRVIL